MTLQSGARLGPYEIVAKLGEGGMGEVFKARDTRLGRTVAIKVLPLHAAGDEDRRRRLEQEARAASALNHPNICVLHDVGREVPSLSGGGRQAEAGPDGAVPIDFLVMELLEGESLAQRLQRAPMTLEEVLLVGTQIADALAAAHRHGTIHRDLKPANVMLVKPGGSLQAKLLDFGLAKLKAEPVALAGGVTTIPTQGPITSHGTLMGTIPYMAPEQLEGREADARSDIFALGCVLYEMLTGRRAFPGDTQATIISAIMTADPPSVSFVQPVTPPALARLVKSCLAKDPDARRQSAQDVASELREVREGLDEERPRTAAGTSGRRRRARLVAGAGVALAVAVGAVALLMGRWWDRPATRTDVPTPPGTLLAANYIGLAVAPDGQSVVYLVAEQDAFRLCWQALDGSPPRLLRDIQAVPGMQPTFSPDGQYLLFGQPRKLVKVRLVEGRVPEGATVEPITTVGWIRGVSWGDDGTVLFAESGGGLRRVPASGGEPREITTVDPKRNEIGHRWPSFLPGGRAALFTVHHASGRVDRSTIAVLDLATATWKPVIQGGSCARYVDSGHLVFVRNGTLLAVRFDLATLKTVGTPVPVATGIAGGGSAGDEWYAVSSSGTLAYASEPQVQAKAGLVWVDRAGRVTSVTDMKAAYSGLTALSPDGRSLALSVEQEDNSNLRIYRMPEGRWQNVPGDADDIQPVWSPDGTRIAFGSNRDGAYNVYVVALDDPTRIERVTTSPSFQLPTAWSPAGRSVIYQEQTPPAGWDLGVVALDGDRHSGPWGPRGVNATMASISPDGRWVVYQSVETGRWEAHVRPFAGSGPRQTISGPEGAFGPVWLANGREILYLSGQAGDNRIFSVSVSRDLPIRFGTPRVAFALPFRPSSGLIGQRRRVFTVSPDGERIVVVEPDAAVQQEIRSLTVVRNWSSELKTKVGR